jgi:ribosomal-protein-alanine N-acetyltransferase
MNLQTSRCRIYQLTKPQFQQFIETPSILWNELGVVGDPTHEEWFQDIMRQSLHTLDELRCTAWWLTNWPIVEISRNTVIGGIGFKGPPNQDGEVEIGYGLAEAFHNKGYMTECIQAVARWALQQDGVKAVIAETEKDNLASEIVLRKNRFEYVRETEEFRYWRKTF